MKKHLVLMLLAALAAVSPLLAIPPQLPMPCGGGLEEPPCEEPPVSACNPSPCYYGSCSEDGWGGYSCSCYSGWQGTNCDIPPVPPTGNYAMTWTRLNQQSNNITHVGSDSSTNAYSGDTATTTTLPILCLYQNASPLPSGVALSLPVTGTSITSLAVGNSYCSSYLGTGWRMAEFHDGWYGTGLASQGGWSFQAFGTLPATGRFWVHINDQTANPWD